MAIKIDHVPCGQMLGKAREDWEAESGRRREGEIEEEWTIVQPFQADSLKRRLSETSPLGFALIGHAVGDEVTVREGGVHRTVVIVGVTTVLDRA